MQAAGRKAGRTFPNLPENKPLWRCPAGFCRSAPIFLFIQPGQATRLQSFVGSSVFTSMLSIDVGVDGGLDERQENLAEGRSSLPPDLLEFLSSPLIKL